MKQNQSLMRKLVGHAFSDKSGKFSKWTTLGTLTNVGFAISDYSDARDEGNGIVGSLLLAGGNFALMNTVGFVPAMAMGMARPAANFLVDTYDAAGQYGRNLARQGRNKPFANSTFVDTKQTYTMRQAGMNLAKQSKYVMQQARLGDEARMVAL